jgi:hypothetical protein
MYVRCHLIVQHTTNINTIDQFNHLSVYPNPASTMVTLDIDLKGNANVAISVVNVLGQTVVLIRSIAL